MLCCRRVATVGVGGSTPWVWLYSGLRSREVSSPASQSKLNLNFSAPFRTFFFFFSAPRYCALISASSFSRSRSWAEAGRVTNNL